MPRKFCSTVTRNTRIINKTSITTVPTFRYYNIYDVKAKNVTKRVVKILALGTKLATP